MLFAVPIFRDQDKKDDIPPCYLMQVVRQLVLPQLHRTHAGFTMPAQGGIFTGFRRSLGFILLVPVESFKSSGKVATALQPTQNGQHAYIMCSQEESWSSCLDLPDSSLAWMPRLCPEKHWATVAAEVLLVWSEASHSHHLCASSIWVRRLWHFVTLSCPRIPCSGKSPARNHVKAYWRKPFSKIRRNKNHKAKST